MRRLAIILTAVALSLSLAACGSRSNGTAGDSSYQDAYDKGYQAGYQAGREEHSGADSTENGTDKSDKTDGTGLGNAVDDVGNAIGDAVTDVGDAVGDALGGDSATRSRTGTGSHTSTFQRMLDNARVTDTDGFID